MKGYIEIDGFKSNIRFSCAHILPGHEKCGALHGHTYSIHARIYGEQSKEGFICDFKIIKDFLRVIANKLDHKILIPKLNKTITIKNENVKIKNDYLLPKKDCILLPIKNTTAECLSCFVLEEINKKMNLSKNIEKIQIGIEEGFGQTAWSEKKLV